MLTAAAPLLRLLPHLLLGTLCFTHRTAALACLVHDCIARDHLHATSFALVAMRLLPQTLPVPTRCYGFTARQADRRTRSAAHADHLLCRLPLSPRIVQRSPSAPQSLLFVICHPPPAGQPLWQIVL